MSETARVSRGGSWVSKPQNVSSAVRNRYRADNRNFALGFRLAEDETEPARVLRGGSWYLEPLYVRSAVRNRNQAVNRGSGLGFRIVESF